MSNNSTTVLIGDGIEFDWDKLQTVPDECYLVALGQREISVLLSCLRYAEAKHLWRWSDTATWLVDVEPFVNDIKGALLMGCNINDIVTQLTRIADNLDSSNTKPAEPNTTNDVLDSIASGSGVSVPWTALKTGLAALFPESAIPIGVGLSVLEFLVNNSNSNESETWAIAEVLGSTSGSLPD